jgi:hypothetical protein
MSQELGKVEKPEVESFKDSRKILQVPLIYAGKNSPAEYLELYEKYWRQVDEMVAKLEAKLGHVTLIFHETVDRDGEGGLEILKELHPKSHSMVDKRCAESASLKCIEVGELLEEMKGLKPEDTRLAGAYAGRDPDDAMTQVPYVKGALLLRMLEEKYGRTRFDAFLRGYFERYAFQSITTREFLDELGRAFPGEDVSDWLNQPGLPKRAPKITYDFETTPKRAWSTQEWLHYLRQFPEDLPASKMAELDRQWDFTASGNAEIAAQWLRMAIRADYAPAYARLERFLIEVGRRKFVKPLYQEMAKTVEGKKRAQAIYRKARPGYHPITAATVDEILK